jgi:DNA polymerase III delta subunit
MAPLKPAYLVCGDDDPKIDAWRARVRKRAEEENGPGALETFDGKLDKPDAIAAALMTLTFATGDRYLLADGVETWKAGELEPLEQALAGIPAGTVLVLIARGKPLARLAKAVEKAGGEQREYAAPKPWERQRGGEGAGGRRRHAPAADRARGRAARDPRPSEDSAERRPGPAPRMQRGAAAGL